MLLSAPVLVFIIIFSSGAVKILRERLHLEGE
jgi:hypothetical protein